VPVPEAGVVVLLGAVGAAVVVVISMLLRVVLAVAAVVEAGPELDVVVLLDVRRSDEAPSTVGFVVHCGDGHGPPNLICCGHQVS